MEYTMNETGKRGYNRTETVPTQAQIEAAGNVIYEKYCKGVHTPYVCFDIARNALTAAAEVGEQKQMSNTITRWINETSTRYGCGGDPKVHGMMNVAVAATIERCAQVADEHASRAQEENGLRMARLIAAAIRALK